MGLIRRNRVPTSDVPYPELQELAESAEQRREQRAREAAEREAAERRELIEGPRRRARQEAERAELIERAQRGERDDELVSGFGFVTGSGEKLRGELRAGPLGYRITGDWLDRVDAPWDSIELTWLGAISMLADAIAELGGNPDDALNMDHDIFAVEPGFDQ